MISSVASRQPRSSTNTGDNEDDMNENEDKDDYYDNDADDKDDDSDASFNTAKSSVRRTMMTLALLTSCLKIC